MKKFMILMLLIIMINCIGGNTCFASTEDVITFSCYTTTSLTKNIAIKVDSEININWGDETVDAAVSESGIDKTFSHTYSEAGTYEIKIKGDNIAKLSISDGDIFEIDLSKAPALKFLNLTNNKLENIDLTQNTLLESVFVTSNTLTELEINSNGLSALECSNNKLKSLIIPNTVKHLYFNNNNLNSFDFSGFSQLQSLACEDNNIETLILNDCTQLETLDCINNFFTDLSLSNNINLKRLYCSNTNLQTLDISNNTLLEVLECVNTNITSLDVSSNVNLKGLYVFGNNLTELNCNNMTFVIVVADGFTNITNGNSVSTLITLEIEGSGKADLDYSGAILFSDIPDQLFINNVEQTSFGKTIDISTYTGIYNIKAVFPEITDLSTININVPQVLDGMIPVKHNGTNWVITNAKDKEWYNYSDTNMKWANVMLRDSAYYLDLDGKTLKSVGATSIDELIGREVPETYTGSMYVWIPRFSYKISGDEVFIKYSEGFTDYVEEEYKIHPAFNYTNYMGGDADESDNYSSLNGSDKKSGMWVAKYPAGQNISNPKYSSSVSEISNVSIGDAFLASKLVESSSTYGVTGAQSHMLKNTEWGAVAYLTTAVGKIENGSTTGNIYGIFGMNDGAEYVSSFIELVGGISNFNVRNNGRNLLPYEMILYADYDVADLRDIEILKLESPIDNESSNYSILEKFYGTGISEVNSNITGNVTKNVPHGSNPFLIRGTDGIYSYSKSNGSNSSGTSFRNVILCENSSMIDSTQVFTIKSSASAGGKISPEGNTVVKAGSSITYSIIPESGYEIIDITVDGNSVYSQMVGYNGYYTYTFSNVTSSHKIRVEFDNEIRAYEVIVNQNPASSAEIEGEGTHNSRSDVTLVANTKLGYEFSNWEVIQGFSGIIDTTNSKITFKMPSNNVILQANFIELLKVMLKVENIYGIMSFEKFAKTKVDIEVGDSDDYVFDKWTYTGIELSTEQITSPSISIKMPENDVHLTANYNKLYPLELTLGDGTSVKVSYPETKEVKITAPETVDGRTFSGWVVSGLDISLENTRETTFTMPSNKVKITAIYSE